MTLTNRPKFDDPRIDNRIAIDGEIQSACSAIVKMGGSIVTSKGGILDANNILSLAREIVEYNHLLIIVHGGGTITKELLLEQKVESDFLSIEQRFIVERFRESISKLNDLILHLFREVGLQCFPVIPHKMFISDNGKIVSWDLTEIKDILARHSMPVLYGDILTDKSRGYYTCSSDQISSHLAKIMRPNLVLFLTDVDGVYEYYPPTSNTAGPLRYANTLTLSRIQSDYKVGSSDMHHKLEQALECAPFTKCCCICNGRVRGNLLNALREESCSGTIVLG
jgi:isopentenyl phosphate kinase